MSHLIVRGDALRIPLPDRSVDLVFGSPPYGRQRTYKEQGEDPGIARGPEEWVDWMLLVTAEALRVSRGAVVWVVSGWTEGRTYVPAPEGLAWEWWRRGGIVEDLGPRRRRKKPRGSGYRPVIWNRVGIPGSGGDQWFRADTEYCLCFKRPGPLPWTDNTAMGHPPKYPVGGCPSHRKRSGERNNRGADGVVRKKRFSQPDLANPGNVVRGSAGKNHMGSDLALLNEAPFPEYLPAWFIPALCPPAGIVLDPVCGSGTTLKVAESLGRVGIGMDLRASQTELSRERVASESGRRAETPKWSNRVPMPGQLSLAFLGGEA